MSPTVAVVFALDAEWKPWRSRHDFHPVVADGTAVFESMVGRSRARVAVSGIGAPRARQLVDALCADRIDALLAVGLAGGLREPYRFRDVIVARRTRTEAPGSSIAGDGRLVEVASRCGASVVETLLCADHIAVSREEKRRLAAKGEAVDMESFRILAESERRGVPSAAIRIIGDAADETLPLDFDRAVRADGTINLMNLAGQAVRMPSRWPAILSFGYRQQRAIRDLAGFLDRFVGALAGSIE